MNGVKGLLACVALGAGEYAASFASPAAESWPFWLMLAGLVVAFGYGLGMRGWHYAFLVLLGAALFFHASTAHEQYFREKPWMRLARRHRQPEAVRTGIAESIRQDLSRRAGIGLEQDREMAALNRAILLGERGKLPRRLKRAFVESGTIHVFAISGLHVMVVAKVLMFLLAFTLIPRRFLGAVMIPILWGYVVVIGSPPSAVRAALMASFYFLAPVFWRRPNGITAWVLAFFVVHLVAPRMIVDVGNALSFLVMLAIILAAESARSWGEGWKTRIWLTCAAWIAGVPIAAHVFGRVTPGGIVANLGLIFAAEISVATGIVGLFSSFLSTTVAVHFNNASALVMKAMVVLSEGVSRLPGANFETERWSYLQCIEWYALIALCVYLVKSVRRRRL